MKAPTIVAIQATDPLMAAVYALRRDVFVFEQHIPQELELDEDDKVATHVAALLDGRVIATWPGTQRRGDQNLCRNEGVFTSRLP